MNIWKNRIFTPMLLKEVDKPFNSSDYLYEIKFDGYRAILFVNKDGITIRSRNKIDITNMYPELKSITKLVKKNTIIDGEIIALENGYPSFSKLSERSRTKDVSKIKYHMKNNPVTFIAFDILYQDKDLTNLSLIERKEILSKIKDNDVFVKSKIYSDGIKLFKKVGSLNLEGIVAKKKDSLYEINKRTFSWVKIKNNIHESFLIGGYIIKKMSISLLLGELKDNKLYYVGNVRLNKNHKLYNKIISMKKTKSSFINYNKKDAIFIEPKYKCMVKYLERTKTNHLRQPIIEKV